MAEDIIVLREFRDAYLLTNPVGKRFLEFYDQYSPWIAEHIARHDALRGTVRAALVPLIFSIKHPVRAALSLLIVSTLFCMTVRWRYHRK